MLFWTRTRRTDYVLAPPTFSWSAGLFPASKDINHAAEAFIEQLAREEIDQFRVMTDF